MEKEAELIPVHFQKVSKSKSYIALVLGDEEKCFAIYADPKSGLALQQHLAQMEKKRPYTHDLINKLMSGLNIRVKQIVINDLQETIYFARLFVEQTIGDVLHIVEIDARPSDCITLALINQCPIYCTREVYEQSVAHIE